MRIRFAVLLLSALVGTSSVACSSSARPHVVTPALERLVSGKPLPNLRPDAWTDLRAFYTARQHAPAWVDDHRPTDGAVAAIQLLGTAPQHGLDPEKYGAADLLARGQAVEQIDKESPERFERLAEFDARLTGGMLAFGRDVAIGARSKTKRQPVDFVAALAKAIEDPSTWVESVRPRHPEYVALQKALDALIGQRAKGGWTPVAAKPAEPALRQRLMAGGHLKESGDLKAAIKSFQELHAIPATGMVDAATVAAMNVPIDTRIRQVALNLQRWRQLPDDLGDRHLFVNVPHFHLVAREHGKPVMDIRVVVGKPGNNTPLFSDEMETVVFSPYWNIPESIAQGETLPSIARDPSFLARQNIEIMRVSGGARVDPSDVDWEDPEALEGYAFRQRPGAGNALGHVKFLFPNAHNVYLHDTPADHLFGKPTRAFSHGCVRVEEPEALAKYVLRDYPEWDEAAIFAAMNAGVEKHVKLEQKIPVHIVYFTAWVDANGGLHFQPDIYGYDRAGE